MLAFLQYYSSDVEHIAGHMKWELTRINVPFTPHEEETMVELENAIAISVPYPQLQKRWTQAIQNSCVCKMLSPLFGTILHTVFKRNMGCDNAPLLLDRVSVECGDT